MANSHATDLESASTQYWSIADASQTGLDFTGDFSGSMWVKFESLPGSGANMTLFGKYGYENNTRAYAFMVNNNAGTYRLRLTTSTNGTAFTEGVVSFARAPIAGLWYHLGFSKSTTTVTMFVNGESIGTATVDSSQSNNGSTFAIGVLVGGSGGTDSPFDGVIDQVLIYSAAIGTTNMAVNYNTPASPYTTNAVSHWKFDNNGNDSIGSNTLTNNNTATFVTSSAFGDGGTIALDVASYSSANTVSSLTWSHTCTGSNRALFVMAQANSLGSTVTVTGVTYNGVAMTQVVTNSETVNMEANCYLFALANPASGANNIVVSFSGSCNTGCMAASYTGVNQTTPYGNSNGNHSSSSTTSSATLTTTSNNNWIVEGVWTNNRYPNPANLITRVIQVAANGHYNHVGDRNVDTAASTTVSTENTGTAQPWIMVAAEIAQFVESGPASVKTFDGVTQSTGVKTYLGVATASTKTVIGVA